MTDICTGGSPISSQAFAWLQAVLRTHSPIGLINPVCSASGINTPGLISPCSGWFQRTNASMHRISPVMADTMG